MKSWKKMMVCSLVACSLLGTGGMMTARAAESVTEGAQAVHFQNGPWKMAGNLYLPKNLETAETARKQVGLVFPCDGEKQ